MGKTVQRSLSCRAVQNVGIPRHLGAVLLFRMIVAKWVYGPVCRQRFMQKSKVGWQLATRFIST
jgi:hypothetical protein